MEGGENACVITSGAGGRVTGAAVVDGADGEAVGERLGEAVGVADGAPVGAGGGGGEDESEVVGADVGGGGVGGGDGGESEGGGGDQFLHSTSASLRCDSVLLSPSSMEVPVALVMSEAAAADANFQPVSEATSRGRAKTRPSRENLKSLA